ncbi:MAG: hypothetical protein QM699_13595 [Amaricoccus sp.]
MTAGWVVFGLVMPAIVAGVGWLGVLANERYLRGQEAKRARAAE